MIPLVSIIYVNYNTSDLLICSIESIIRHCRETPFEIIIIDNASRVQERNILKEWLSQKPDKQVNLIFSDENAGFAKANNVGAEQSNGKYLFFLNPDTLVVNDVLKIFSDFLESSDLKVAAIGGNLLRADLSPNYSYGNFPGILLELCNIGLGLSVLLNGYYKNSLAIGCRVSGNSLRQVPYIVGAAIFTPAVNFKLIQGFDESYFMYYEETDLFLRFKMIGLNAYILPEAKIVHFEGAAIGKSDPKNFNYHKFEVLLRSKVYYYKKWKPKVFALIKAIILMQIIVQYLKGKWGNDFKKLFSIYQKCSV